MKQKIQSDIKNSIEYAGKEEINSIDSLLNGVIEKIKELDKNNVIEFDNDETQKLTELATQYHDTQLKRVKSIKNIDLNNIDYSNSINNLLEQHTKFQDRFSTDTLIVVYRCIELEDENKKLTLTDEQYRAWLETSNLNQYITTKQFSILYGLSANQHKSLRQRLNDPLPCYKPSENSNILYNRLEVEKWFENFKQL